MPICGAKITIPPIPGFIPSESRELIGPSGRCVLVNCDSQAKEPSIQFIGYYAIKKTLWKIIYKIKANTKYPKIG
jgi:hypothetical protein